MSETLTLERYKQAYRENRLAEEKLGFYIHLTVFVFVNALLATINVFFTPWVPWIVFPVTGWGIGIVAHYLGAIKYASQSLRKKEAEAEYTARAIRP